MKKRLISVLLITAMVLTVTGCGSNSKNADIPEDPIQATDTPTPETNGGTGEAVDFVNLSRHSFLGDTEEILYDESLVPSVTPYSVAADFSNVYYNPDFAYIFDKNHEYYNEEYYGGITEGLIKNNFVVTNDANSEFFDIYESNWYGNFPNFVTVDSLMHTYHVYFAHLLKKTEKNYLSKELSDLSKKMLSISMEQYDELQGTDWENAAYRNVIYFYIGALLQDNTVEAPIKSAEFSEIVNAEFSKMEAAGGIDTSLITGAYEDYSQYKARGYYAGDEVLEQYFRAMMFYGRTAFEAEDDDMLKSAILVTRALSDNEEALTLWDGIYNVTAFFAGASDDAGVYEFADCLNKTYGSVKDLKAFTADKQGFENFKENAKNIKPPQINSIPIEDGEENMIPSFRFMGQRFTVDEAIFGKLIYSNVKENAAGDKRMLPDMLDVPAALGSQTALEILDEKGETGYRGYSDNLKEMSGKFDNSDPSIWNASLYAGWLNTLRPLLVKKGEGYPSYMTNDEWAKKDLETFGGSYAELKHDTILYAKQVIAEMGGFDEIELDDRGYVDPEPVVYSRFAVLSKKTKEGLLALNMLSDEDVENLDRLVTISKALLTISEKELKNEEPTAEEYQFIKDYGGNIAHFWIEANKEDIEQLSYSYQAPCPIVADIATNPNGSVLEVGTGYANTIYVIVPVGGGLRVARGSVYSFYQFEQPISDRLTDEEWQAKLSPEYDEVTYRPIYDNVPEYEEWTLGYRLPRER